MPVFAFIEFTLAWVSTMDTGVPKELSPRPGNCLIPTLVVQAIHSLTLALRRGHGWSREGATPTGDSTASFLSWVAGLGLGLWPDLTPKSLS